MQLFVVRRSDKVMLRNYTSWNYIPRVGECIYLDNSSTGQCFVVDAIAHIMDLESPSVVVTVLTEEEWRALTRFKGATE